MRCSNCNADNTTDLPLCPTCASSRHFTHRADCRCDDCRAKCARLERARLEEVSWVEERQYQYGSPIQVAA